MNDKALEAAYRQLSLDFHFDSVFFSREKITYIEPELFDSNARKCFYGKPYLEFIYNGTALISVADDDISVFVEKYLNSLGNEYFRAFDAPQIGYLERELNKRKYTIAHIAVYCLPENHVYRECQLDNVKIYYGEEVEALYEYPGFTMALNYGENGDIHDCIAAVHYVDGKPVAIAAASDDAEALWQVGVDVLPEYRKHGIGTRLVNILTEEILKSGHFPYYCYAYSNIKSSGLAKKCGYQVAWMELTAKPIEEEWIRNILDK